MNHSIWWKNLSPHGGDKPQGDLASAIDDQFGSFENSVINSPQPPTQYKDQDGPGLVMTHSARSCSLFKCMTNNPMSPSEPSHCSVWTCSSTRIICNTRTPDLTTSKRSGMLSTGLISKHVSPQPHQKPSDSFSHSQQPIGVPQGPHPGKTPASVLGFHSGLGQNPGLAQASRTPVRWVQFAP